MTHRPRVRVEKKLEALRQMVLRMGHLAEAILDKSLTSIWQRDADLARQIAGDDLPIDRLDVEIDQAVLELLALQAPVAQDLRQVIAMKTAATDLERVGDLARNLAKSSIRLASRAPAAHPPTLETLAGGSQRVLRNALSSLADCDADAAREVLSSDDQIDEDEDRAILESIQAIQAAPDTTEQGVDFILIAKNLERVGDHAMNIAEDVVLVAESVNLKHAEKLVS